MALLILVLRTGALQSPFLLLLPLPLLLLALTLEVRQRAVALGLAALALAIGEGLRENLGGRELLAVLVGMLLVEAMTRRFGATPRPRRSEASVELAAAPLPAPGVTDESAELQRQVMHVHAWSGAAAVTLWKAHMGQLRAVAAAGRTLPGKLALAGDPIAWVAREGTPLWLDPTPSWSEPGRRVAAARVWQDEDVDWILTCEYEAGAPLPSHETLATFHDPLRIAFEVLRAQRKTALVSEQLARLEKLLDRIPLQLEVSGFGAELLDAAMALTAATGGTVGTWHDEFGVIVATAGDDGGPEPGMRFQPPESELGLAVRKGDRIVREGGQWRAIDNPVANPKENWLARPRALVSIPLTTPSGTAGALALWTTTAQSFDPAVLDLLSAVMPYAGLHLHHAREYGQVRERADRDALTGLRNRRAFDAAFLAEQQRVARYPHAMSVLMVDVDHFKSVNDQLGHEAGDEVLRTVAGIIDRAVRDVDIPARYGGEEFIVLLPETGLAAAREVAERVRAAVERTSVYAGGAQIDVRVSVGVSSCPEVVDSPLALPGSADAALYVAKERGRNRVETAVRGR